VRELLETIDAWQAEGLGIARAVVVRTYGSAPRREGSALLVASDGRIAGSVSGGCVEGATVTHIEEARTTGEQRVVRFGVSDEQAWEVGLACGGTIDVLVQPSIPDRVLDAARDMKAGRAVVTTLPDGPPGATAPMSAPLVVDADGRVEDGAVSPADAGELGEAARIAILRGLSTTVELDGREHLIEVFAVRPRLVIIGGVPVAQALGRLARELGYEVLVVDPRPAFVTRERFPDVDRIIVGWPDEVADEIDLGPADAVAVLSHDPKVDEPAITEALRRGCRYVGAIGSRKTQGARRERLLASGLSADEVGRLHGPIGLDLGGRAPAETALAILAEVVATRYGAAARPMREAATQG
jgi:xanthine dehydrogenase accessory factor